MLILSRKLMESIVINDNIEITVLEVQGDKVRIGISAPKEIPVVRKEIIETTKLNQESSQQGNKQNLKNLQKMVSKP